MVGEWSPSIRSFFLFARAPEERRREDGRPARGGQARTIPRQRDSPSLARGSQPRPDVQEGRPAAAAKLTPEAQARGQRAEHEPRVPARHLAKPGVQPGAEYKQGERREAGTLILWPRSALLVTKYGGFNEVQETPPEGVISSASNRPSSPRPGPRGSDTTGGGEGSDEARWPTVSGATG